MANEQEEIQKTLADLQRRSEEFQMGKSFSGSNQSSGSNFSINPVLKNILLIGAFVLVVGFSIFLLAKSGGKKADYKAPKGYEVVYPKNAPPRLEKIR